MGIFDLESREALVGTPTVTVGPNASGNVLERLEFIGSRLLSPMRLVALSLGIPLPTSEPVDRAITEDTTLEDVPIHYYRNLSIAPGVTVRLRNGPMIIVVEGDLAIGEGAVVDGDGLGGKGGASAVNGEHGKGGYGGTFWQYSVQLGYGGAPQGFSPKFSALYYGTAVNVAAAYAPASAYPIEGALAGFMFTPGAQIYTKDSSQPMNGFAWNEPSLWGTLSDSGFDWLLYRALVFAILSRTKYHSTYGGLGGGGGGSGASSMRASVNDFINVWGGSRANGKGSNGDSGGEPGGGGAGFGGGGWGGQNMSTQISGATSGAGGNGGGTQLWVVKRIGNAGIVRSNGQNGGNASGPNNTAAGGGGGGGGGCAALLFWETFGPGVGTWQANGGQGGSGFGVADAAPGGTGGAGMVRTLQYIVRAG